MKALSIIKPNVTAVEDISTPEPADNEVLIKVMASGICGTDIHILRGKYMANYPIIPGHEFSGIIEKAGDSVKRFKVGDRVVVEPNLSCDNCVDCLNNRQNFCKNWQAIGVTRSGAMAQYVTTPEKAVFSIDDLPFEEAAFVEPLSCVIHGIERTKINIADKITILGAGPIGILLLKTIKIYGAAETTVVDKNTFRIKHAKEGGADKVLKNLEELKRDYYDVVIDATGAIEVIRQTIDFVRPGGAVLLFGVSPSGRVIEVEPFKIFKKGITILSSFTSVRNSYQAVDLLRFGRIKASELISHRYSLEGFEQGIGILESQTEDVMKVMILPNGYQVNAGQ